MTSEQNFSLKLKKETVSFEKQNANSAPPIYIQIHWSINDWTIESRLEIDVNVLKDYDCDIELDATNLIIRIAC